MTYVLRNKIWFHLLAMPTPGATPNVLFAVAHRLRGGALGAALLLFSAQPVVSRLVLPKLGGSLAVLNTCVCFFQAALPPVHGTRT